MVYEVGIMGISLAILEELRSRGLLSKGARILDIGSSNLYHATSDQLQNFIARYSPDLTIAETAVLADRLAAGSAYDAATGGANKSFVGELLDLCGVNYLSFDIAAGYKTEIFDLNRQTLPDSHRESFDIVINCGTTEHVFNQFNSFTVIHDAAKVGGHIMHQLPVAGFTDHCYFIYTGRFFFDLAGYNDYDIVDLWYDGPADNDDLLTSVRSYKSYFPKLVPLAEKAKIDIPNCALTIIYRKTKSAPFNPCLEMSTSVGNIPQSVQGAYHAKAAADALHAQAGSGTPARRSIAGIVGDIVTGISRRHIRLK